MSLMSKTDSAIHKLGIYYIFNSKLWNFTFYFCLQREIYSLHDFRTVYNGLVLSGWDSNRRTTEQIALNCPHGASWYIEVVPIAMLQSHLRFAPRLRLRGRFVRRCDWTLTGDGTTDVNEADTKC